MGAPATHSRDSTRPLSSDDMVRLERRNLLATSVISIAVGAAGVVPEHINFLGVTLTIKDQIMLVLLLAAVQIYFMAAHMIYSAAERRAIAAEVFRESIPAELERFQIDIMGDLHFASREAEAQQQFADALEVRARHLVSAAQRAANIRRLFHYTVPLVIGCGALVLLSVRVYELCL